jgi:hypothetical protein
MTQQVAGGRNKKGKQVLKFLQHSLQQCCTCGKCSRVIPKRTVPGAAHHKRLHPRPNGCPCLGGDVREEHARGGRNAQSGADGGVAGRGNLGADARVKEAHKVLRGQSEVAKCEEEKEEMNEVVHTCVRSPATLCPKSRRWASSLPEEYTHTRRPCAAHAASAPGTSANTLSLGTVQCGVNSFVKSLCKMTARKSAKVRFRQNSLALHGPRRVRISPDVSLQLLERSNLAVRVHLGMDPRLYGCDDIVLRSNIFSS